MNELKPDAKSMQWLRYGVALILLMAFPPRFLGPSKLCPFCRSKVAAAAMVCPHCQQDIDSAKEMAIREDLAFRERNRRALAALGAFAVVVLCCVAVFLTSKPQ
jgi:predicted amidophosphoribosyltransferase